MDKVGTQLHQSRHSHTKYDGAEQGYKDIEDMDIFVSRRAAMWAENEHKGLSDVLQN